MQTVEILWTGGFDSSFRIAQLSVHPCVIQPYYIMGRRKSAQYELNAIETITKIIEKKPGTRCVIKPLIVIDRFKFQESKEIMEAFAKILKTDYLGNQYKWLAHFMKNHQGLELCIHIDDKAFNIIKKYGKVFKIFDKDISYYILDKEHSSDLIIQLFGNFHFPLLDFTKKQMQSQFHQLNLNEVAFNTWFCHQPIDGQPCGQCNPCYYTIKEGLTERFSVDALNRYRRHHLIKSIKGPVRSIRNVFKNLLGGHIYRT